MRNIGLHVRSQGSFSHILDKAVAYNLSSFQCFFMHGKTGKRIDITSHDVKRFQSYRLHHTGPWYVHGSYWINLSDTKRSYHPALQYEIRLAKELGFTHIILHPGSINGPEKKLQGIHALARALNTIMSQEQSIYIVLENTAHGNRSVGSDIHDFSLLLPLIAYPERLQFCLDTAHAFAYGYDITTASGRENFVTKVDAYIGIERVALLHVNDSMATCGSKIDRHAILNQGHIKEDALKPLVMHDRLVHIPLIMELPVLGDQEEHAMLTIVQGWHK